MADALEHLAQTSAFMPHGMCYLWQPGILSLHVASDALITLAYFSIPFTLLYFVRKRSDLRFHWMFVCFAVFIVACGTTHLLEIWTIWNPDYWLSGGVKAVTALASVPTAILLLRLVPQALSLPSPAVLENEVRNRRDAEEQLRRSNVELEARVAERTAALEATHQQLVQEYEQRLQAEEASRARQLASENKLRAQLERLDLLDRITRAIGERQDLKSIYNVVLRSVEDHLPVDFASVCLDGQDGLTLTVAATGPASRATASELALEEEARLGIDQSGLTRCIRGSLVYEPDLTQSSAPFPVRLARGGLRSLVIAPLAVENRVFGVMVAARRATEGFTSAECEFLRQLAQHVALAAHQAQLYNALQAAYEDLRSSQQTIMQQERLRAIGQMASGIAHDINNALSPASIHSQVLLEGDEKLSPDTRDKISTIQRAIDDVSLTVSRIREFARREERPFAPVKIGDTIRQVIELTRARWSAMPQEGGIVIEIATDLAPDLPAILGAENEIRDALTNLIFNAVDAMPNGGTLTLRARAVLGQVIVEVCDTGIGMDEKIRSRCLEPFFTTKGERGTGLGLPMVFGAIQRHGAQIEIDSAPGQGTTMRLLFTASPQAVATHTPATVRKAVQPVRVLLIDDDELVLKTLQNLLAADGHIVSAADGGQSGIDEFRLAFGSPEPFALVITDLGMPYVDGRAVAGAIKALSPTTPVLLLTGWGSRMIDESDRPANIDRVLGKPPSLQQLRATVAELTQAAP